MTRDAAAARAFVYAVRSTGIYCRPSCPSRRPRRDRVIFFDTAADAERAGYRACRRCRPDADPAADSWTEKIRRACVYLANVNGSIKVFEVVSEEKVRGIFSIAEQENGKRRRFDLLKNKSDAFATIGARAWPWPARETVTGL